MKHAILLAMMLAPQAALAQEPAASLTPNWYIYAAAGLAVAGIAIGLGILRTALAQTHWNLAVALSEEVEISDPNNAAQKMTQMAASSSRLIAFMGLLGIFFLFLGFGLIALYRYGVSGEIPKGTDQAINFLMAGMTLFAPYVVNKFASVFGK